MIIIYEIIDRKNISGEIPSHQNLAEIIDPICNDNRINFLNTEK